MRFLASLLFGIVLLNTNAATYKALLIDGQNNHDYKSTTPHLKKVLEQTGLFEVEVATTPPHGGDMSGFKPAFDRYQVVISNYSGDAWPAETQAAFVRYLRGGGGFVSVHAADNSFPEWSEYNEAIAVGGWGGRNEKSGPYLRLRDGAFKPLATPGTGGSHGKQHAFVMVTRAPNHPVMAGLPSRWMHAKDELYDRLRGPAQQVEVLSSAFSSKESSGSGEEEPLLMAVAFGKGRVFHTALGHNNGPDITAQRCVGFITTLQRGTEWAASGKVTQKAPTDFPTAEEVKLRE